MVTLLAALALSDVTSQSFTIPTIVAPMPRVMQRLSEVTKTPFRVHNAMTDEVLALGTPELPLSETMEKIALATEATWTRENGGYLLYRTDAQNKARRTREAEVMAKRIEAQMKKSADLVKGYGDFTDSAAKNLATQALDRSNENDPNRWRARMKLAEQAPASRLANRLLLSLNARDLATLEVGSRVVFSSNPTRLQIRFPNAANAAIQQFLTEQNRYAEAAAGLGDRDQIMFSYDGLSSFQPVKQLGKVLLIIKRESSFGQSTMAELKVANAKGQIVAAANQAIAANPMNEGEQDAMMKGDPIPEGDLMVTPSNASKGLMKLFRDMMARTGSSVGPEPEVEPELRKFLLRPDLNDPTEIGNQEVIEAIVTKQNVPVAMVPSDLSFFGVIQSAADQKYSRSRWEKGFKMADLERVADPKWVIARPAMPISSEMSRINRAALAKFLTRVGTEGRMSLDNQAQMVSTIKVDPNSTIFPLYLMMAGLGLEGFNGEAFWIKLYASLNADQKKVLERGEPIGRIAMSAKQIALIEEQMMKGRFRQWESSMDEPPNENEEDRFYGEKLSGEPTEALVNGLPNDVTISGTVKRGDALFFRSSGMFQRNQTVDENQIAWDMFQRERPDLFTYINQMPPMKEFVTGTESTWTLTVGTGKQNYSGTLRDDIMSGKKMTYQQMSDEFKKKVEESLKRHRESYKDAKPGDFGGPGGRAIPPAPSS